MLRLSHSTVVVEDILVSPREIPPILHHDDKEPIVSLSSCLHFQLGQDSNRVFFQVFKCCGIPVNCKHNIRIFHQRRPAGIQSTLSWSRLKPKSHHIATLIGHHISGLDLMQSLQMLQILLQTPLFSWDYGILSTVALLKESFPLGSVKGYYISEPRGKVWTSSAL